MAVLSEIWRYPVKSLPGEALRSVDLASGQGLPDDRRYAFTNGVSNTLNGAWLTTRSFFVNSYHDGMQRFEITRVKDEIVIRSPEGQILTIRPGDPESLAHANENILPFLYSLDPSASGPVPQIVERRQSNGKKSGYWDFSDSSLCIINARSVEEIGRATGEKLDIRRFRGNLVVGGLEAWTELDWPGRILRIGEARLEILRPAFRCPATSVNPVTGFRDLTIPDDMQENFGHLVCGVYARVVEGGSISSGEDVTVVGNAELDLAIATAGGGPDYRLWPKPAHIVSIDREKDVSRITVKTSIRWGFPEARPHQRWRVHIRNGLWGMAEIETNDGTTSMMVAERTPTGDPATAWLIEEAAIGDRIAISGPFGDRLRG